MIDSEQNVNTSDALERTDSSKMVRVKHKDLDLEQVETVIINALDTTRPAVGLILSMLAGVFVSLSSLCVKLVESVPVAEIVFFRSMIGAIAITGVAYAREEQLKPVEGEKLVLSAKCLVTWAATILSYKAIKMIPLGDSQTIIFSAPVWCALMAWLILNEPIDRIHLFSLALAVLGIVLISEPSYIFPTDPAIHSKYHETRTIGTVFACSSALSSAAGYIIMKFYHQTPTSVTVFWYNLTSMFASFALCVINRSLALPKTFRDLALLFGCGFATILGQKLISMAMKCTGAGPVSAARSFEVIMAFIFQSFVLDEKINRPSLIGVIILCGAQILMLYSAWVVNKASEALSVIRRKTIFAHRDDHKLNQAKTQVEFVEVSEIQGENVDN